MPVFFGTTQCALAVLTSAILSAVVAQSFPITVRMKNYMIPVYLLIHHHLLLLVIVR
jgi:hypothetical protein